MKRILRLLLCGLMVALLLAPTASAATRTEILRAKIYGGADVSAYSAKKEKTGSLYFTAKPSGAGGWSAKGDEVVWFRGRDFASGTQATEVTSRAYRGSAATGNLSYLSSHGKIGDYYKMAIQYDNTNPYEWVNLEVSWTP